MIEDRSEGRKQILWNEFRNLFVETGRGAGGKSSASGFDHAAHMVDEHGAGAHENIS